MKSGCGLPRGEVDALQRPFRTARLRIVVTGGQDDPAGNVT